MAVIIKCIDLLKNLMYKIWFRIKLKEMDDWWYCTGASSWELFPPSFYYTHTEEETEHITQETKARIQALINQFED